VYEIFLTLYLDIISFADASTEDDAEDTFDAKSASLDALEMLTVSATFAEDVAKLCRVGNWRVKPGARNWADAAWIIITTSNNA
jgi:hypothetical protein